MRSFFESDSLSEIVLKLNENFRIVSLVGGGPKGDRGDQGMPGQPGSQGLTGPTGPIGEVSQGPILLPFFVAGGTTGPKVVAGPWPRGSLNYLNSLSLSASNNVYIDHRNSGYWRHLSQPDATGQYALIVK